MDSKDVLEKEISGEPVTVSLGDKSYPLAFPMFAIALYKQETAKLNYRRAKQAEESGRPRLTDDELRQLRSRYGRLLNERQSADDEQRPALMEEIVELRSRLDEESGSGDSLLVYVNWWKIRSEDPDRIVLALWAGLHAQQSDESWKAPFSLGQLIKLVDFSNVGDVVLAIGKALAQHMPKAKEETRPNAERPTVTAIREPRAELLPTATE